MQHTLIYLDERDRSFGLSGMAISLAVLNHAELIQEINIDRNPESIEFAHDFYFSGNPRCSAKMVWEDLTRHFHLSIAMALGNIMARRMIALNNRLTVADEDTLHEAARREGLESCGLEQDEIDSIWDNDYKLLSQVFSHPAVRRTAIELSQLMIERRVVGRSELADLLSYIMH